MVTIIPQNPKPWHPSFPTSSSRTNSSLPFASKIIGPKIVNTSNNDNETKQSSAGKIKREVLTKEGRTKLNTFSDREFYAYPRFVTHVDNGFISTLTNLYRQRLRPGSKILDLMSSWVSHLPEEVVYKRVVGHGLNAQELAKNPRLDYFIVKDLNQDQKLEFEDGSFDAALCTVSVQYLQRPEKDLAGRLLTVNKAAPRASQPGRPRSYRIYFGNLPWQVDDTHLVQVFSEHGKVVNARIVYDRETGRSCGFGFVIMSNEMEPNDAIAALDGQSLDGRAIRVNVAEERLRRDSFSVLGDDSAKHDVYLLYLVYSLGKGDPNISFLLEWTL